MFKKFFLFLYINFVLSIFLSFFSIQASSSVEDPNLTASKKRSFSDEKTNELRKRRKIDTDIQTYLLDLDLEPLNNNLSTLSIEKVEDYFLFKDVNNRKMDQIKLHKFLYYAQGFSYTFFGSRLIGNNKNIFKAHQYGPYSPETSTRYLGACEIYLPSNRVDEIKKNSSQFSNEQKFILDFVYDNYKNMASFGSDGIVEKTHQEAPWKDAFNNGDIIEEAAIKIFFQSSDTIKDFIIPSLNSIQNISSYKIIDKLIKKNFTRFYNEASFYLIEDAFSKITLQSWKCLENIIKNDVEMKFQIGDGGDSIEEFKERLLAYFFFPDCLLELNDPIETIYQRPSIIKSLSISAFYNHPLSVYHLYRFCSLHSLNENNNLLEGERDTTNLLKEKLFKLLQEIIGKKDEINKFIEKSRYPYFIKAFLCEGMDDSQKAEECFLRAYKEKDLRSGYYYAGYQEDIRDKEKLYEDILSKDYEEAYIGLGFISEPNRAFKYFIKAGEAGYPQGYYQAAKMLESNSYPQDLGISGEPIDYYEKAGDGGMLSSYSTAAELYFQKGDIKKAISLYKKRVKQLDPIGYYELGEMYQKLDDEEKAIEYYLKSELPQGYFKIASLTKSEKDQDKYKSIGSKTFTRIFEHIHQTVFRETNS